MSNSPKSEMVKEIAEQHGMTVKDVAMSKKEKLKAWQENYDKLGFSKFLWGDEALITVMENDKIEVKIRKQTSADESRNYRFVFDTQSQCERLLPALLKGLTR